MVGFPAWSPDGSKIVFVRVGNKLWLMNADGSGVTQLTDGRSRLSSPAWSPDGSKIVFVVDRGPRLLMNADGTGLTQLPLYPAGLGRAPA